MALSIGNDFGNNYGYSTSYEERLMLNVLSYNKIANNSDQSLKIADNSDQSLKIASNSDQSLKIANNSDQSLDKVRNYAQEGELMYEKKMDLDEDGTITFDEVKVYCQQNKVSLNEVLNNWQKYRMLENEKSVTNEVIKSIEKEENESESSELIYAQKGDEKYKAEMDSNEDNKITFKEYYEYCSKNNIDNESRNNVKDIAEKYGLSEDAAGNSLKTKGNIEVEA